VVWTGVRFTRTLAKWAEIATVRRLMPKRCKLGQSFWRCEDENIVDDCAD